MRARGLVLCAVLALWIGGCRDSRPATPATFALAGDLSPVRTRFNAEKDKVRVIMLVAPS